MPISIKTGHALQNKFKGSLITGDNFWGQIAYVKAPGFEGMLMISSTHDTNQTFATLHTADGAIEVTQEIADRIIASTPCRVCYVEQGHKLSCPMRHYY